MDRPVPPEHIGLMTRFNETVRSR